MDVLLAFTADPGAGRDRVSRAVDPETYPAFSACSAFPPSCASRRAATLTLARREFVIAAQALGATPWRHPLRELLPNVFLAAGSPSSCSGVAVTIVVGRGHYRSSALRGRPPISKLGQHDPGRGARSLDVAPAARLFLPAIMMSWTGALLQSGSAITLPRRSPGSPAGRACERAALLFGREM